MKYPTRGKNDPASAGKPVRGRGKFDNSPAPGPKVRVGLAKNRVKDLVRKGYRLNKANASGTYKRAVPMTVGELFTFGHGAAKAVGEHVKGQTQMLKAVKREFVDKPKAVKKKKKKK